MSLVWIGPLSGLSRNCRKSFDFEEIRPMSADRKKGVVQGLWPRASLFHMFGQLSLVQRASVSHA